jgi:hypothetical protein
MQWLGGLIVKFLMEKLLALIAGAISLFRKIKADDATNKENAQKLEEAQKGGDDEAEARASEDLLNGNRR